MANIKSAKKRIKVIDRQKAENKFVKATIATYTKKFRALVEEGKFDEAEAKLKETISLIDSAESKGILHKNNASRKVGRLSYALAKARFEAKPVEEVEEKPAKTEAKVEEVKEVPVAKKAPAKKTTAKKAEVAEEKPVKKATAKKAEVAEEKPAKKATKTVAKKETKAEEKPAKKTATKKTAKAE